jgi:decaprenylphospho-beta-D-erythro-pentofuranosid-2-ulose 2-reductase
VQNAFGQPQTIVLLGGTSDIGVAIARELLSPVTRTIVLACRDVDRGEEVAASLRTATMSGPVEVDVVHFDAEAFDTHAALLERIAADRGDLDIVVLTFGMLGRGDATASDPSAAARLAQVNFTGAVSASLATANQLRQQGHGTLVVMSSVAGERVRKGNFVYGSTKAGLDGFAQGLADWLEGTGVRVLIVRPGFVHSAMTRGLKAPPFSTTPDKVASAVVKALRDGRRIVWTPGILRLVFMAFRHTPAAVWRRLPLG